MLRTVYGTIRHEFGLKVLSVLLAAGLWFYVINTEDPIRTDSYNCTVRATNVSGDLDVVKIEPAVVDVRVRGRLSALERSRFSKLRLNADVSGGKRGRNQAVLSVAGLPDRVTEVELDRSTAQVWLDHRVDRNSEVTVVLVGSPAEGFDLLGSPTVEPSSVRVSGSAGGIEEVARVVAKVDIGRMSQEQTVLVEVSAQDEQGKPVPNIALNPPKVTVEVPISQVATKQVPVDPQIGAPASGYVLGDVRPSPDTVTLKGRPDVLEKVAEAKTAWVNIRSLRTTKAYKVRLLIPEGVVALDDVYSVSVRVTVRPVQTPSTVGPDRPEPAMPTVDDPGTGASNVKPGGQALEPDEPGTSSGTPGTATGDNTPIIERPASTSKPDDARPQPDRHSSGGDSPSPR